MHSQPTQSALIDSGAMPKIWTVFRYRHLPDFSWPWVWARTRFFSIGIALYFAYNLTYLGYALHRFWIPVFCGLMQFCIWVLTAWAGPAAATIIKAQNLSLKREAWSLTGAILGCVLLNIFLQDLKHTFFDQEFLFSAPDSANSEDEQGASSEEPTYSIVLIHLSMFTMGFLVAGGIPLLNYLHELRVASAEKMKKEVSFLRQRVTESDSRLAILQAQIEPHFLFNTLASVKALMTQDAEQATKMIDAMSDHLRTVLPKLRDAQSGSSLGEQLDICASYLRLMQLRMGERFTFRIYVPHALKETSVPPLLLLPLVENAVTHGIEPKTGPVRIDIVVWPKTEDTLQIEVRDNGVGLVVSAGKQQRQGVGLVNVREQLALRYGSEAGLEVISRAEGGTSVMMILPRKGRLDANQPINQQ